MEQHEDFAALRRHVVEALSGGSAHVTFDQAVRDLPAELRGAKPDGQPHTIWRLVEHMRIAQRDLLDYATEPDHESPPWPDGYWPGVDAPDGDGPWLQSLQSFRRDLRAFQQLVESRETDLLAPLPRAPDKSVLRQALVNADHNAYHLGQLITVRKLLGAW